MKGDRPTGWTVRAVGVTITDGKREERPFEDFTEAERAEMAARRNLEALKAAGYVPVNSHGTAAVAI